MPVKHQTLITIFLRSHTSLCTYLIEDKLFYLCVSLINLPLCVCFPLFLQDRGQWQGGIRRGVWTRLQRNLARSSRLRRPLQRFWRRYWFRIRPQGSKRSRRGRQTRWCINGRQASSCDRRCHHGGDGYPSFSYHAREGWSEACWCCDCVGSSREAIS